MTENKVTRITQKKITFGLIVGTRGIFNQAYAADARDDIVRTVEQEGYGYVVPGKEATPNGAVETLQHAKLYAKYFSDHREEIDGLIVVLPNFGDEIGVIETIARADLNVPVMVQAYDDQPEKVGIKERRDSFCGKISVCNNLYQYTIPWTDTREHTCLVDSEAFRKDLDRFSRICRVVKGLRNARIGAIGARPAPFQTVRYSEKLLQETGITIVPVDLSEIFAAANSLKDEESVVKQKLEAIRDYGTVPSSIPNEQVVRQAKFSITVDRWMEENECDASTIQCWESMQKNYGCAACLYMSMAGENLMPSACEVDVAGAVSMYALALASGNAPGFLDWNNNYGKEKDMMVGTHCSNYPRSFIGTAIEISSLDVLGENLGREKSFGAIKGKVAPGDMTFFRISTDDQRGFIKAFVGEGEITDHPFPMHGGVATCKINNLRDLLRYITKNGFEHHFAMVRGFWGDILDEAISTYLDWDIYYHNYD